MFHVKRGYWSLPSDIFDSIWKFLELVGVIQAILFLGQLSIKGWLALRSWKRCSISCFLSYDERFRMHYVGFVGSFLLGWIGIITLILVMVAPTALSISIPAFLSSVLLYTLGVFFGSMYVVAKLMEKFVGLETYFEHGIFTWVGKKCETCGTFVPITNDSNLTKDKQGVIDGYLCKQGHKTDWNS